MANGFGSSARDAVSSSRPAWPSRPPAHELEACTCRTIFRNNTTCGAMVAMCAPTVRSASILCVVTVARIGLDGRQWPIMCLSDPVMCVLFMFIPDLSKLGYGADCLGEGLTCIHLLLSHFNENPSPACTASKDEKARTRTTANRPDQIPSPVTGPSRTWQMIAHAILQDRL